MIRNVLAIVALLLAIISLIGFLIKIPMIETIRALANLAVILFFIVSRQQHKA